MEEPAREPSGRAVVVDDVISSRVRKPGDLGRLFVLLLIVALLVLIGVLAPDAAGGASRDLARVVRHLPRVVTHLLSFLAGLVLIVLPLSYVVELIVRRPSRRLIEAVGTGAVALALVAGLARAIPKTDALYRSLTLVTSSGVATAPLDSYLAAVVAFSYVGGLIRNSRWRPYFIAAILIYAISALAGSQATLLALGLSFFVGLTLGALGRYVFGMATEWPSGERIAEALADRGIPLARLSYAQKPPDKFRRYAGVATSGKRLDIQVLDRDLLPSGTLYRLYRMIRLRPEVARAPELSLERTGERRALLALAAEQVRLPTPALAAGVPCGPDTIVLAYESMDGEPLADVAGQITESQLVEFWQAAKRLHEHRATHRGFTLDHLFVNGNGRLWVTSPTEGTFFASGLRINLDRADLLVTTVRIVGPSRGVQIAREVIGESSLAAIVPVLQPIALSRDNRLALRRDRKLLGEMVQEIQGQTPAAAPKLTELERVRPRTVIMLVALIIAGYLLVGQLGSVDLATVFRSVHWGWTPAVVAGSVVTFIGAAIALTGYVREHLAFNRTVVTQLAASFTGFVAPSAVGNVAVNVRYLQKSGLSAAAAGTSVAVTQLVNAVGHVILLILFAAASGTSAQHSLPIPGWAFIALGVVAVAVAVVLTIPQGRRWLLGKIMPTLREAWPRLLEVATNPVKLTQGIGGTLLLNAGYIFALWSAVEAFGDGIPFATVAVVYLAGGAIGSIAPTPGGLGAVEAALSTGLAAAGMPGASAVSAVLLYRLATFWIPVPIGWLAFTWLQRHEAL